MTTLGRIRSSPLEELQEELGSKTFRNTPVVESLEANAKKSLTGEAEVKSPHAPHDASEVPATTRWRIVVSAPKALS